MTSLPGPTSLSTFTTGFLLLLGIAAGPALAAGTGETPEASTKASSPLPFGVKDRLHVGAGLGYAAGDDDLDDFGSRIQVWWDVLPFAGLEGEWLSAGSDHGFNFSLSPKLPLGNFTLLTKFGALLLATDTRGNAAGHLAFAFGAGVTYQFEGTPLGLRAEWTGLGEHAQGNLMTAGAFYRW